jgi:transcriptional regulator with XRE-family HTH domain
LPETAMAASAALIDALKHTLKACGLTYARVARHLGMSEASVKRMFSRKDFTLKRLDRICDLAHIELSELARNLSVSETRLSQLTPEQEKEIIADRKLFLVAVCALNQVTFEQIVGTYDISRAECTRLLLRLDRLKFIELLPNNRIRLLVSQAFSWLPDGPIQRFFNQQAHTEFFRSRFDRPHEFMVVVNGMLSRPSTVALVARLKRIAKEVSEMHNEDVHLPLGERSAMSVLVAIRHWELEAFAELRRRHK